MINIVTFQSLCQESEELVSQNAARLNGRASKCDFTAKCACQKSVSYYEPMQSLYEDCMIQEGAELCQAQPAKHKLFGFNGAIFFWFGLLMVILLNC